MVDAGTLEQAYRRADHIHWLNAAVEEALLQVFV
jgi:hypothetical protein